MKVQVFRGLNILLWSLAALTPSWAQDRSSVITSEKHAFRVVTLLPGLENPWSVAFLPDGRMLVTERAGRLRLVGSDFRLAPQPIEGLPEILERGQGGLFDVVLHPLDMVSVALDQLGEHVGSLTDQGQAIADALDELLTRSWG